MENLTYRSLGFRTRRGVHLMSVALAVLMINVTIIQFTFAGSSPLQMAMQIVWIVGVFLGTYRILKGLEKIEKGLEEPDEGMTLAFDCASALPVVGYVPFFIFGL